MSQFQIKRDKAIKVFKHFDFTLADRWDNDRMALKLKGMADQLDLNDIDNRSVQKIIAAVQDSTTVVVFSDEEDTKSKRDGKMSKRKSRTKKDRKQETELEQEQELTEDAEQEQLQEQEPTKAKKAKKEKPAKKTTGRYTRIQAAAEILGKTEGISMEDLIDQANQAFVEHGGKDNPKESAYSSNLAVQTLVHAGILVLEDDVCRRA